MVDPPVGFQNDMSEDYANAGMNDLNPVRRKPSFQTMQAFD